jgi:hypothetical protein
VQQSNGKTKTASKEYEDFRLSKDERQALSDDEPDVLLDVDFTVEETDIAVEGLRANFSIVAELADLVKLSVRADLNVERVDLTVKGVEAGTLFKVRLNQVRAILEKALATISENPEILHSLVKTSDKAVEEVGGAAGEASGEGGAVSRSTKSVDNAKEGVSEAVGQVGQVGQTSSQVEGGVTGPTGHLLEETVNVAGQRVQRIVDDSGSVVERTIGLPSRSTRSRFP